MRDVQNTLDSRGIDIQKVGINGVYLPFLIRTKAGGYQPVLAKIKIAVDLPKEYKGTHMSRFVEVLSSWSQKPFSHREMKLILSEICERLNAGSAHLDIEFKYFIDKEAPVSRMKSLLDCDCAFSGTYTRDGQFDFVLETTVPFTSLCPCSKEISSFGAHNQRGTMRVRIRHQHGKFIWIEDLAALMEAQGSAPVYPLLKREDEKYVTEQAYRTPKFVEDVLRDLVLALRKVDGACWMEVECENYESIHNHNAYAHHVEEISFKA